MASNPFRDAAGAGAASGFNPWVMGGAVALSALNSAFGDDKSDEFQDRLINLQERGYNDREPFRALSLARLSAPMAQRPDLTQNFADPSNPFYREPQPLSFGQGYAPPGASKPERALKSKGLASLVKPPGPTPEEQWNDLAPLARNAFPQLDPRLASLPEEQRKQLGKLKKMSPGAYEKALRALGV